MQFTTNIYSNLYINEIFSVQMRFLLLYQVLQILVSSDACLIREKVVTFRMVKLNMLLSIFLITK